jgi:ribosomal protein S21
MIYVSKKEQETSAALVRRFMQRVQASGVLKEAKGRKFYKKPSNRNMRRVAALEREKKRAEQIKLRKYGKVAYK